MQHSTAKNSEKQKRNTLPMGKLSELSVRHGVNYVRASNLINGKKSPSQPEDYALLTEANLILKEVAEAKEKYNSSLA